MEYIYDKMELRSVLFSEAFVYAFVSQFKAYNDILRLFLLRA